MQVGRSRKQKRRFGVRSKPRKSTEEGLEQEFNSLDAQRESAEAFIASRRHEGWICLPEHYDDGGFSGGNIERLALQRLFADIEADGIDCLVVYKVDRMSRALLDFARTYLKKVFWPNLGVGAGFQILNILQYACGLEPDPAYTLDQNPLFEIGSRIIDLFGKFNVSFVSVTQQFNTTSSMGRLTLNILLSFVRLEREMISSGR